MIDRDDLPETPDWHCEPHTCPRFDKQERPAWYQPADHIGEHICLGEN